MYRRIYFLCYSSTMLQGLERVLHFQAIYRQSCRLWATITVMFASVTDGQDQSLILFLFSSPRCVPFIAVSFLPCLLSNFLPHLPSHPVHLRNLSSSNFPNILPSMFRQNKYFPPSIHVHMMFLW